MLDHKGHDPIYINVNIFGGLSQKRWTFLAGSEAHQNIIDIISNWMISNWYFYHIQLNIIDDMSLMDIQPVLSGAPTASTSDEFPGLPRRSSANSSYKDRWFLDEAVWVFGRRMSFLIFGNDTCWSGWWFGCHFLHVPINIGFMSSSQLTNSNTFQRGFSPTTNQW